MPSQTRGVFEGIGLAAEEEDLYLRLLSLGPAPVQELATQLQWAPTRVRSVLKLLESKGFVTQSPTSSKAYVAVAPDAAVEHLALRREEEIARARSIAAQLAAEARAKVQRSDPAELVEVVVGTEAIIQRVEQLETMARTEVAVFSKPPYLQPTDSDNVESVELLARGIRCRVLIESAGLEQHESGRIQRDIDAGEETRVLGEVPMKLIIFDDEVAISPVTAADADVEAAALVLHAPSVVRGMKVLFEVMWERAVPIGVADDRDAETGQIPLDDTDRELLRLIASGFTDEVIAGQMALHPRTVRRRLRRLMDELGAETRFQAGMQVVRLGLIASPTEPDGELQGK